MRVTVCELPHRAHALAAAWAALSEHTVANASQIVLLPELALAEPVWEFEQFDPIRWTAVLARLDELGATRYLDVGPGKVLAGLVRKTLEGAETETLANRESALA